MSRFADRGGWEDAGIRREECLGTAVKIVFSDLVFSESCFNVDLLLVDVSLEMWIDFERLHLRNI